MQTLLLQSRGREALVPDSHSPVHLRPCEWPWRRAVFWAYQLEPLSGGLAWPGHLGTLWGKGRGLGRPSPT